MIRLLLDANLSPETASHLRSLGFDVRSLIEENLSHLDDESVIRLTQQDKRVVVTFDLDFGEIYYFSTRGAFSVIILRLSDQRIEQVNEILTRFFKKHTSVFKGKHKKLIVLTESSIRLNS